MSATDRQVLEFRSDLFYNSPTSSQSKLSLFIYMYCGMHIHSCTGRLIAPAIGPREVCMHRRKLHNRLVVARSDRRCCLERRNMQNCGARQ